LIRQAQEIVQRENISPDRFDFEMLFGVRRDLQLRLVRESYRVRVYLPYGEQWYPYLVRRLAERPANIGFFLRSLFAEALSGRRNGHP
jgi:proline dehydrogenase